MIFPKKLMLLDSRYALDGGTTALLFSDENNKEHTIVLNQYAYIPDKKYLNEELPGRLYFNEKLIEIRSTHEKTLLNLLKSAELLNVPRQNPPDKQIELSPNVHVFGDDIKKILSQSKEENLRSMLENVISFVESDKYISFAEKVNQKLEAS